MNITLDSRKAVAAMPTQIQELTEEIRRLCTEKGWRKNLDGDIRTGYAFPAYIALLHSEASEALEAYREKEWSGVRLPLRDGEFLAKPVGVGPELADVFIRLLDMCDIWGIDLEAEVRRVLDYGWTREYQHGGKTL